MKAIIKYIFLIIIPLSIGGMFLSACDDDEAENGGQPVIYYIRSTDPEKSDSLYGGAFLGNLVAIVGDNLGGTKQVFFNDQEADLTSTYITNTSILVNVPSEAPIVKTDKMRLVFNNGTELIYDFEVEISAPELTAMKNEWAKDGETAVIYGNYFFEPLTIKFSDGTEVSPQFVEQQGLAFEVPPNAPSGPITISTNFGETVSSFHFRDERNLFLNYDDLTPSGSWRPGTIAAEGGLDGNYLLLKGVLNANQRTEDFTGGGFVSEFWAGANGRPEGNLFNGNPEDYVLKFEVNIVEWYGSYLNICFAPWGHNNANNEYWSNDLNARAIWGPWEAADATLKTDGWITAEIPLTAFAYGIAVADGGTVVYNSMPFNKDVTGSLTFWVVGTPKADASPVELRIDNVRIVTK